MIVHFSAHISKWELICKFGVIFHIFIVIPCLCSRFHVWNQWFFLLCNNLFIYQVLCTLIYRRRSLYSFISDYERNIFVFTYYVLDNMVSFKGFCFIRPSRRSRLCDNSEPIWIDFATETHLICTFWHNNLFSHFEAICFPSRTFKFGTVGALNTPINLSPKSF